jgi:inner membrane protein
MLLRTHLAISLAFILICFSTVSNKFVFILFVLLGTIIPDIDSKKSFAGNFKTLRPIQLLFTHRGFFHSLLFMVLVLIFLNYAFPIGMFGFFVGFLSHILADIFTLEGIRVLYPFNFKFFGFVKTGELSETIILFFFVLLDIFLFLFVILLK